LRNVPATNLLRRVGPEANFNFLRDLGLHDLETPAESFRFRWRSARCRRVECDARLCRARGRRDHRDLAFTRDDARRPARRRIVGRSARLIASMLSDPQARLPLSRGRSNIRSRSP
jgi:penicillin-binding protein 1C